MPPHGVGFSYLWLWVLGGTCAKGLSLSHAYVLTKTNSKASWDRSTPKTTMKNFLCKTATTLFVCATLFSCSDDSNVSMTCPDGYTGTNCMTKKTPTKIKITKIDITSFPSHKDNMSNWDNGEDATGTAPDVFLALRSDSQLLLTSGILTDAASSDLPLTVTPTTPIVISNISEQLTIGIFDSDGNLPEEMAVSQFYSYRSTDVGFPFTIMINDFSQGFSAIVYVSYEW